MKSLFSSCVLKLNVSLLLGVLSIVPYSFSVRVAAEETCVKAPNGNVICGTPMQTPGSSQNRFDSDKTIDTQTDDGYAFGSITWELKYCIRQEKNVVHCNFVLRTSKDRDYSISVMQGTKLVDSSGKEYAGGRVEVGDRVVGGDNWLKFNMTQGARYKTSVDFPNVNTSVSVVTLLQVVAANGGPGLPVLKFRNVPILHADGSMPVINQSDLDTSSRNNQGQNTTNNTNNRSRICLPIIGCITK